MKARLHQILLWLGSVICFGGYLPQIWNLLVTSGSAKAFLFGSGAIESGEQVGMVGAVLAMLGFIQAVRHIVAQN